LVKGENADTSPSTYFHLVANLGKAPAYIVFCLAPAPIPSPKVALKVQAPVKLVPVLGITPADKSEASRSF